MKNTAFLILKTKWFDLIKSGNKTSEFRDDKPYYQTRLLDKNIQKCIFQKGYSANERMIADVIEIKRIFYKGRPTIELKLGNVIHIDKEPDIPYEPIYSDITE